MRRWVRSVPGGAEVKNNGFSLSRTFTPTGCQSLDVSTFLPVRALLPGVSGKEMSSNARWRVNERYTSKQVSRAIGRRASAAILWSPLIRNSRRSGGQAARGDESAVAKRLAKLEGIGLLTLIDCARALIPKKVLEDALHVAVATAQGMDFLLTWNCRHIANAEIAERREAACLKLGYRMPTLFSPEQLMGD